VVRVIHGAAPPDAPSVVSVPMAEGMDLKSHLRALLAEIAVGHYRDQSGHRLTLNAIYLEAWAALELEDTLDQPPSSPLSDGDEPEESP
jgi:hypothetical protein